MELKIKNHVEQLFLKQVLLPYEEKETFNAHFRFTEPSDREMLIKYRKQLKNLVLAKIEDADDTAELFLEELNNLNKRLKTLTN